MIEIMASSNVEIPTEVNIKYTGQIETEYEQELPTIASMTSGSKIYVKVEGEEGQKITFRTKDGSIIDKDNSIYQVESNTRLLFIAGTEKYSVFEYPSIQPTTVDPVVINEIKNDVLTNSNEIVTIKPLIDTNKSNVEQLESDMVDVQATTTGNNDQLTVHSTEISTLNNNISTNTLSIATNGGKINQIESSGIGHGESISGIQDSLSQILTQASGFSRRNYNEGFEIPSNTAETIFMPNVVVNEAWLNPVNGGYDLLQGKQYVLEAEWTSDTVLTKEIQISFELQDGEGNGVYDLDVGLIRDVRTIAVGQQVSTFKIGGHFIPDQSGNFKMVIVCTPTADEVISIRNINNSSLLYEHDGLVKFLMSILKVTEV